MLLLFMGRIRRHYERTNEEVALKGRVDLAAENLEPPIVLVPVDRWNAATEKALQFALTLSPDVQAVHVTCDADEDTPWTEKPPEGTRIPKLVTLPSPFRLVLTSDCGLCVEGREGESGADGGGGDCFDGGAALVSLFSA
jgi:hypothetical protein